MVNLKDYKEYVETMKEDRQDYLNYRQYKYIHKGTGISRANQPQYKRAKMLRKLMHPPVTKKIEKLMRRTL